jgi:hypothetical protein
MAGILIINRGESGGTPDIWVLPQGSANSGPPGIVPIAGQPYDVWVRLQNVGLDPSDESWCLFVQWAIPTGVEIPLVAANFLNGNVWDGCAIGLPIVTSIAPGSVGDVKCATTWVPTPEMGGQECLIAEVYNAGAIGGMLVDPGGPLGSLNGNSAGSDGAYWTAQRNLPVLPFWYKFLLTEIIEQLKNIKWPWP